MNDFIVGNATPIGLTLRSFDKPKSFQHSDEWRNDIERLIDGLFASIDALMIRVSAAEQENSAMRYKIHKMQYAGDGE